MSPDELDNELEELENRLERLRALYDQYFLGIEKIEPTVARKDVDRRIWVLRREQIRNTGRRFRLQTLVMRYNTFQQYWQRICREIENGTYTRHMLRAERAFGEAAGLTIAARKRLGMFRRGAEKRDEREHTRNKDGNLTSSAPPPEQAAAEAKAAPAGESAAIPRPKLDDLDLDMDFFAALEAPEPAAPDVRAPAASAARVPAPPPVARTAAAPSASVRPPVPAAAPPPGLGPPAPAAPAAPAAPRSAALPPAAPAAGRAGLLSRLGAKGPAPAPPPATPKPADVAPAGEARRASTPPPAAAAGLSRPAADRAARLVSGSTPHRQAPAPPTPASGAKAAAPSGAPHPAPPTAVRAQPGPSVSTEHAARRADKAPTPARSAPKNPVPRKDASAAKPSPESPAKAAAKPAGVTDERIRELHGRLVDAKRQVNDAGKVTVDGLTKSLRAAESRLRQQHGDRRIDFDVVIKDGKAVVKPILR